jgi:hypothetical protein
MINSRRGIIPSLLAFLWTNYHEMRYSSMVSKVRSLGLGGIRGYEVSVECYLSSGLPAFDIVGLPDAAVKEARERVRAAVKTCGMSFPISRITVNLERPALCTTCPSCSAYSRLRAASSLRRGLLRFLASFRSPVSCVLSAARSRWRCARAVSASRSYLSLPIMQGKRHMP